MADESSVGSDAGSGVEKSAAAVGTIAGAGALFSAAACCVLPLVFAAAGLGAGGLAALVPYHWPLTIAAALAVAVGWGLCLSKRRTCAVVDQCAAERRSRMTVTMLGVATVLVALSALWKTAFEAPLVGWFGA